MKSLQSHAKRFNLLQVGTKAWNQERLYLESLDKKGLLTPIKIKKEAYLNQFGYEEVSVTKSFVVGRYSFKLIDYYTF